jgi:hypothetical protein
MFSQTIALFRYQLLSLINTKNMIVFCSIYLASFLLSRFSAELAIINSDVIGLAVLAEFLRYSLVLFLMISVCHQISQDYELGQFNRLLAMPIARWQYVLAEFFVVLVFALIMNLVVFLLLFFTADSAIAVYWSIAVFLELILVGLFSILAALSLEKLPIALVFSFVVYLFSKLVPLINYIFNKSSLYYQDETGFQLGNMMMQGISFVLPDMSVFAQNNALFESSDFLHLLFTQASSLMVYGLFIFLVILVDFYRKEIRG